MRSGRCWKALCARWATKHITDEQIEELEEMLSSVRISSEKRAEFNAEQVSELDGKFHESSV